MFHSFCLVNEQYVRPDARDVLMQEAETRWNFDVYEIERERPGHALSILGFHLLKRSGVVKAFALDESKLVQFLRKIELGYKGNPYHNRQALLDCTL